MCELAPPLPPVAWLSMATDKVVSLLFFSVLLLKLENLK